MAETVVRTGVELRLARSLADRPPARSTEKPGEVMLAVQVFVDLDNEGSRSRVRGTVTAGEAVPLSEDPTRALVRIAQEARDMHLGDLLGDVRRGGCDVTRFEFYATPFQIELADDLRERLTESWRERPPR
jgi:hypothetical protein